MFFSSARHRAFGSESGNYSRLEYWNSETPLQTFVRTSQRGLLLSKSGRFLIVILIIVAWIDFSLWKQYMCNFQRNFRFNRCIDQLVTTLFFMRWVRSENLEADYVTCKLTRTSAFCYGTLIQYKPWTSTPFLSP